MLRGLGGQWSSLGDHMVIGSLLCAGWFLCGLSPLSGKRCERERTELERRLDLAISKNYTCPKGGALFSVIL